MPKLRQMLIDLAILAAIGVVLALIGPFGSFQMSIGSRLVYWVSLALAGYLFYRPIGGVADWLAKRLDLPNAPMWVAATLVATVPMTLVVWLTSCAGVCRPPASIDDVLASYGYVLVIGAGVTLIFYVTQRKKPVAAPPLVVPDVPPPVVTPTPRFLDRLPPHLGRDLCALEMEDHYVRAHTRLGSDLILMRLRDAVEELDGMDGAQVHRSWWVARNAVTAVRREGRNVRLALHNGLEAPVARDKVAVLKAAGWY